MSKFDLDDTYDGGMTILRQCRWCCHYDGHLCYWGGSRDKMEPNDSCGCFKVNRKDIEMNNENMENRGELARNLRNALEKIEELKKNLALSQQVNGDLSKIVTRLEGENDGLNKAITRITDDNESIKERNESLSKRVQELLNLVEVKNQRIDALTAERGALSDRCRELTERNEYLEDRLEEKDEQIEKMKNELDEANAEIGELGGRITERHATNRELAKNCVRLETENREKDEQIEKLKKDNDFFRNSICNEADLRIGIGNLSKLVTEKNKRIEELETWNKNLESDCKHYENEQLNNRSRIASLDRDNEQLLKDFGEAAKEVEEKRTLIIKLENENREKEAKIASLTQELADCRNHRWSKDSYTKELEDQLDRSSDVVSEQELKIEDLQKKLDSLIERNKALKWVLRELYPETFVTRYLGRPMGYDDGTSKICYKCCPEIKKLIDDAKERLEHDERVFRSTETFNLDISSLYPKKFDLNPNADCPAYAARMKAKYDNLRAVGFTEDQTMSLLPLWTDE